jgi:hypothetical protein
MDNNQHLQYHLTNINTFDIKNIDIEKITVDKTIYNIYNNSINEPLHNFWFLVDNCKFLKSYENKNNSYSLVYVFNNKYEKHNKTLSYITQLLEHIKTICIERYNNISYILPWLENDNFPVSIIFQYNPDSLYINHNNNDLDINTLEFNTNNNFTLLFEIKYFTINNNKIKLILVAKLIQLEKQFDLKKSLNTLFSPAITKVINENTEQYITPINKVIKDENVILKPVFKIGPDILLATLNKLKNKSALIKDVENKDSNLTTEYYIEEKNQLKKTIVNPDKDSYKIMKDNYLEEKGIDNTKEVKVKKKKIIKVKKIKENT